MINEWVVLYHNENDDNNDQDVSVTHWTLPNIRFYFGRKIEERQKIDNPVFPLHKASFLWTKKWKWTNYRVIDPNSKCKAKRKPILKHLIETKKEDFKQSCLSRKLLASVSACVRAELETQWWRQIRETCVLWCFESAFLKNLWEMWENFQISHYMRFGNHHKDPNFPIVLTEFEFVEKQIFSSYIYAFYFNCACLCALWRCFCGFTRIVWGFEKKADSNWEGRTVRWMCGSLDGKRSKWQATTRMQSQRK